jgi:hypothetical protein
MATQVRPKAKNLYDEDFYVWTESQADLLRKRQFDALDLGNLIEEVEGLGDAKKSAVLNNPSNVIESPSQAAIQPGPGSAAWLGRIDRRAPHAFRARAHTTAPPDPR